jgi:hypothetical protein
VVCSINSGLPRLCCGATATDGKSEGHWFNKAVLIWEVSYDRTFELLRLRVSGDVPAKRDRRSSSAVVLLRNVVYAHLSEVQDKAFGQAVRRYYGSEEPFLMARKGYAGPLTLRAKSNPCRPADEQKTAKAADQSVRWGDLLQPDEALMPATHKRFITPKAKRRLINAQQQQRQ